MTPTPLTNAAPATSRWRYAALMAGVCLGAIGFGLVVASLLGGDGRLMTLVGAALSIGCVPTFIPVLFGGRNSSVASNFGVCVLVASVARTLLIMSVALLFEQMRHPANRPAFWIGTMAGAGLILIVESIAAIMLLQRVEQLKMEQKKKVLSA